jgi:GMP synthase (glutamine-hydrolysing)
VTRVLALTHLPDRELGLAGPALAARGCEVTRLHVDDDARPDLDGTAGVLVLGGAMGVPDADAHPFLRYELALLADAVEREIPVLGICLGAQLLAAAAGGHVRRMESPCVGWLELAPSAAAADDPLAGGLPPGLEVLEWHLDAIQAPPGATVLAETTGPGYSIFRVGEAAWGTQLHLELTPSMLAGWLRDPGFRAQCAEGGLDPDALAAEAATRLAPQMAAGREMLDRFAVRVGAAAHAL